MGLKTISLNNQSTRSEDKLIFAICAANSNPVEVIKDRSVIQIDWKRIQEKLEKSSLGSLFYYNLKKNDLAHIIGDRIVLEKLKNSYFAARIANATMTVHANEVFREFNRKDIDFVPIRRFDSIYRIYSHDNAVKQINDIDILIRKKDAASVREMMLDKGFSKHLFISYYRTAECFSNTVGGVNVIFDIRNNIPYLDINELWKNTRTYRCNVCEYRFLTAEYDILYQIMHACYQHYSMPPTLEWALDIHNLINFYNGNIDWQKILSLAVRFKARYGVNVALSYLKDSFDTPIPENARGNRPAPFLRDKLILDYCRNRKKAPKLRVYMLIRYGFRNKLCFFIDVLFPKKTWLKRQYGANDFTVYIFYIIRPLSVLIKSILRLYGIK